MRMDVPIKEASKLYSALSYADRRKRIRGLACQPCNVSIGYLERQQVAQGTWNADMTDDSAVVLFQTMMDGVRVADSDSEDE